MEAREARKIAEERNNGILNLELNKALMQISSKAKKGKTAMYLKDISPKAKNEVAMALVKKGYDIKINKKSVIVKW